MKKYKLTRDIYSPNDNINKKKFQNFLKFNIKLSATLLSVTLLSNCFTIKVEGKDDETKETIGQNESSIYTTSNNTTASEIYKLKMQALERRQKIDEIPELFKEFEDPSVVQAYLNYHEMVEQAANKWGVPKEILMAMLIQESHGLEENLMQISYSSWDNQVMTAYDYEENEYVDFILSNDKDNYCDIMCITKDDMKDPMTNITVGALLLKQSIECMDNHILAGVQCYNLGAGNMNKVLKITAEMTNTSKQEILENQQNIDFMQYTNYVNGGDPNYVYNILKFVPEETFSAPSIDEFGNININTYVKENTKKVYSLR